METNEQVACNNWEKIGVIKERNRVLEFIDAWLSTFIMDANCPFCIAQYSKLEEIRKRIEQNGK